MAERKSKASTITAALTVPTVLTVLTVLAALAALAALVFLSIKRTNPAVRHRSSQPSLSSLTEAFVADPIPGHVMVI